MNTTLAEKSVSAPARNDTRFLDGLRGLAAFYVLVHHARAFLHEGVSEGYAHHPQEYTLLQKALLLFFGSFKFGHGAVVFFFVLSGFVIHLRYARDFQKLGSAARFQWSDFVYRRARRLYPPMLVALLLTFILDSIGSACGYSIYSLHTIYANMNYSLTTAHMPPVMTWATLLGALFFLTDTTVFGKVVRSFGTDSPLWSLKFEWWFYMLYPSFRLLARKSVWPATFVLAALFGLSFFPALWPMRLAREIFSMMLVWWLGALLAEIYVGRLKIPWLWIAPLALILPVLVRYDVNELFWGLMCCGVIAAGFAWQQRGGKLWPLVKLQWLGEMSYSLYVCHFPILVLMSGWLMSRSPTHELPHNFQWIPVGCAIAMAVAYVVHLFAEVPFTRSRSSRAKLAVAAGQTTAGAGQTVAASQPAKPRVDAGDVGEPSKIAAAVL